MPSRSRPIARINRLYSQAIDLLERDMGALLKLTYGGEKLPPGAARDLVAYAKLLEDMKAAQERIKAETTAMKKAAKKNVSDEDLEKAIAGAAPIYPSKPISPQAAQHIDDAMKQLPKVGMTVAGGDDK